MGKGKGRATDAEIEAHRAHAEGRGVSMNVDAPTTPPAVGSPSAAMDRRISDWGFGNHSTAAGGQNGSPGARDERVASLDVLGVSALEGYVSFA